MNLIEMINEWMLALISSSGYLGIFLAMFVEGIFTPIPSELIMPFAGYLASTGHFNLVLVILIGSLGAVCGSIIAYFIGRKLGRPFMDRYGRYFGFGPDSLCRADAWFAKWGNYGILVGHALPGIRSIISFPAGIARMDLKRFALFTFLGATVWNTVLTVAGYFLGEYYITFAQSLDGWDIIILAAVAVGFLSYVAYGRWKNKNRPHCEETADGEHGQ
ncbi:MAG: DedA family protein [Methanomassiliicoccus sp.]|nr:DedA family protein [Methanomassiliicoccus sp.]